jgi:transposase-like protein
MTCHNCRIEARRNGKRRDGLQRYRCPQCGKTYSDGKQFGVFGHKQIDEQKGLLALQLLLEGTSIRSAQRISGVHRNMIFKLLVIAGERCEALLATKIKAVPVSDVQ